jgi:hypothetical protein
VDHHNADSQQTLVTPILSGPTDLATAEPTRGQHINTATRTAYNRRRRWSGDSTWEKILDELRGGDGAAWTEAADATVVRAHQHMASTRPGRGAPLRATATRHGRRRPD